MNCVDGKRHKANLKEASESLLLVTIDQYDYGIYHLEQNRDWQTFSIKGQ